MGDDDYLDLDQVAAELDVARDTAHALIRAGDLPGAWIPDRHDWYVRRRDLDTYRQQ